jgi:hypothetical protein
MISRGAVVALAFGALGFSAHALAEDVPAKDATDAASPDSGEKDRQYLGNEPLESCMNRWDPGTHMTKDAWRESCKRITEERAPYAKGR